MVAASTNPPPSEPPASPEALTEDRIFDILAAGRRRELLRYLDREGGRAGLMDIARAIAHEEGVAPDAPAAAYKPVYVSVYQTHVPKLEATGVVGYDPETKTVSLRPVAAPLFRYLALAEPQPGAEPNRLARLFRRHREPLLRP